MTIPLVDLKVQYRSIKSDVDAAIQRVLDHTGFILGEEVASFERSFAAHVGVNEAVGVASGTAALHLALLACGIGPGDEVVTTAHTFAATVEAISHTGARPVFVDIDPGTYTIDPGQIEDAIGPRTRALLPVHLYGHPADMDALSGIAARRGLWLIEDAAQAHGARHRGRPCGSIGHLACFSFYPGKNLGAYGDAGAVTGNDSILLTNVRRLRAHGRLTAKYEHEEIGFGERMDALQAAVLQVKLKHLDAWIDARRAHADRYNKALADCGVAIPHEASWAQHAYHLYVIRTTRRDALLAHLRSNSIEAGIHYPIPVHQQLAYRKLGFGDVSLPVTERVASEVLSLPMYPELEGVNIDHIANTLKEGLG